VNIIKNRYIKFIFKLLLFLLIFYIFLYLWAINGEAYKYSLTFIKENKQVVGVIGKIENLYLSFRGNGLHWYVSTNGTSGHAEYNIVVNGQKGKGIVYIYLEQNLGKWKVVQGKLFYGNKNVIILNTQ